jgi:hypothetical protein
MADTSNMPTAPTAQQQHERPSTQNERLAGFLRWFQARLEGAYGPAFTSRIAATPESATAKLRAWESLWADTFAGKQPARIKAAIDACVQKHRQVFTPRDFGEEYRQLSRSEPKTNLLEHHKTDPEGRKRAQEAAAEVVRVNGRVPYRTRSNAASGAWTDEMEARFQRHVTILGLCEKYGPTDETQARPRLG